MLLNGLYQSQLYEISNELEVSQGYVDIYIQRSHLLPDIPYEWIWEIKYIKKEDANKENILEKEHKKAGDQLKKYRNSSKFSHRTDVRYLSLIFIGKDKYEIKEV
jgi:hypothetical protein